MSPTKTNCQNCDAEILVVTANRTGGMCMPCFQGARYEHLAYLSIRDFFSRASHEYCLAPNLEPHPNKQKFEKSLLDLLKKEGVSDCIIPVIEYESPDQELDPCSDRIYVIGAVKETAIAQWAKKLGAEYYREERPGKELPLTFSKRQPVWCLVWD